MDEIYLTEDGHNKMLEKPEYLKTVKLKDLNSEEELEYTLSPEAEANYAESKISITCLAGQGLLGHKVNDIVDIKIPAGIFKI